MQPIYSGEPERGFVLEDALDDATCARLVAEATAEGFLPTGVDYPPSYRDNDRLVRDDPALARWLFDRLAGRLPATFDGGTLVGLNERFRFCRYQGGQRFRIHRDGAHSPSDDVRSRLTLQIYLDDGFDGGRTRFYDGRRGMQVAAVQPVRGRAIVFDHDLWHDGEPVTRGVKHVLRTDVLYRSTDPRRGYVWAALVLGDGRLVTASRDRTLRMGTAVIDTGHAASIHALIEATPGVLLTGSRDHTLRAIDLAEGTSRLVGEHDGAVLCFTRFGAEIVSGGADGAIVVRDGEGRARRVLRGHRGWVWSLCAVGDRLVSASEDGSLRLWDGTSCLDASWLGRGPVHALAALDAHRFVAGYADGHVIEWRIRGDRLECVEVFPALDGEIYTLSVLEGGRLAVGGEQDVARVFEGTTCVRELPHHGFVRTIVQLPDGRLASGGYDGEVRLWPAEARYPRASR